VREIRIEYVRKLYVLQFGSKRFETYETRLVVAILTSKEPSLFQM